MTKNASNEILRDFIYIDKDKMYSLYSQIFEGVAESLMESISMSNEETKKEGSPKKNLEERIIEASVKTQNIVLFDHIYNMLEEKLSPYLLNINETTTREDIKTDSIIKITGYALIEDYEHLSYLMGNLNSIGMALATLTMQSQVGENKTISKNAVEQAAREYGLVLDKKLCDSIVSVIENFHGSLMEVTVEHSENPFNLGFKAPLDSQYLRLSPNMLRNLYGYKPCMKWTIVGEVTSIVDTSTEFEHKNKSMFAEMFKQLDQVDNAFTKMNESVSNIVRIAPIAVYIEHERFFKKEMK
ncbi:MAG: hypothetical protein K2K06_12045 [Oscillospiraceae bacterium]|nr:hypothetical protein [Oscillospiraceae bacterium]